MNVKKKVYGNLKILENLNDQRQSGNFCDFTLRTQDGGSFSVHKAVVAIGSSFFEAKFRNTEFGDSTSDSLELPKVSKDVLGKIIEFMYTSETTISSESAREMLDTALFLGLNSLVDGCTEILAETVNQENCFDLLSYSESYHCGEKLTQKCIEIIVKNVEATISSPGFNEISFDGMKKLVSFDRSELSEECIYLAAIKWISFDLTEREQYIRPLLDAINFEKLSHKFRLENVFKNNPLLDNIVFLKKCLEVQEKNSQTLVQYEKEKTSITFSKCETVDQEIRCAFQKKVFTVFEEEMKIFTGNEKNLFQPITAIETRKFGYANFKRNDFFICGGYVDNKRIKSCRYFSFDENCWKELPSMKTVRSSHRAINLNDRIYACGGIVEKTVEIFDANKICWTEGPSLPRHMNTFGLCTLDSCIYAIDCTLVRLDPRENIWRILSTSCSTQYEYCSSIAFDNFIYRFDFREIHKFDVRNNKWIEEEKKLHKNEFFETPLICQLDDETYVFGLKYIDETWKYSLNTYNGANLNSLKSYHLNAPNNQYVQALFATDK